MISHSPPKNRNFNRYHFWRIKITPTTVNYSSAIVWRPDGTKAIAPPLTMKPKVIPMKAYNQPERNPNHPHLTPVDSPVSDRTLLLRYQAQYRQTGRCESLPVLAEIARLAHQGQLIAPKEARALFADLDQIESTLPSMLQNLTARVTTLGEMILDEQIPSPQERFALSHSLTETLELTERLMAIARNHPAPPEPGVEEGFAPCYAEIVKEVNDLRHSLAYLSEHLHPLHLGQQLQRHPYPELQLLPLQYAINHLHYTVMALVPRLRENIARKVPQLWGSVDTE